MLKDREATIERVRANIARLEGGVPRTTWEGSLAANPAPPVHRMADQHADYDVDAVVVEAGTAAARQLQKLCSERHQDGPLEGRPVRSRAGRVLGAEMKVARSGKHVLEQAWVDTGEYVFAIETPKGFHLAVHVLGEQFPVGALGWNRFPVFQWVPQSYYRCTSADDAERVAQAWAQQIKDQRAYDAEGWGWLPQAGGLIPMADDTLEAIDYYERYGARVKSSADE